MKEPFNIIKSFIEEGIPSGRVYSKISFKAVQLAALQLSCSIKEVEITALKTASCPNVMNAAWYYRGAEGQIVLLKSRAAVVGLGSLGGFASELLARMGVGTLVLIDGDSFSETI